MLYLTQPDPGFRQDQKKHARVRAAYETAWPALEKALAGAGAAPDRFSLFLRAFKQEAELEAWIKPVGQDTFLLLKTYPVCYVPGKPGPKRKEGDNQVPEGFYFIDRFNPASSFHLSLGINYPNAADKLLSDKKRPGGDIFIHGNCVSVGCLPLTDVLINEVYLLAVEARAGSQERIPVHVFPCRAGQWAQLPKGDDSLLAFWDNLKPGLDFFDTHKRLPVVQVGRDGRYALK